MQDAGGWVYILASGQYGTLYVGSTRDLIRRVYEHKEGPIPGFTKKYGVKTLVWFEAHDSVAGAHAREKSIKRRRRDWKIVVIEKQNPRWEDLYPNLARFGAPL